MIIALAYCDKDIDQALRWMQWVEALFEQTTFYNSSLPIALIYTRWAKACWQHAETTILAKKLFRDVKELEVGDSEQGWPAGPNFMFKSALDFLSGEDVLWMEPDAVAADPDWIKTFVCEWGLAQSHGKHFMGSLSKFGTPHMTGIGVYGARWREFAPQLAAVPAHEPFDSYGGQAVLNHAWITGLIQHRSTDRPIQSVDQLEGDAVIYHPDKDGRLIAMLDRDMFGGECDSFYGWSKNKGPEVMPRQFYHAENTNRSIRAGNARFNFESYLCIGGTWQGVYTSENETEISLLDQLASDPRTSVSKISQEEYEKAAQKKSPMPLHVPFPVRKEIPIQGPGAVVVDNPSVIEKEPQISTEVLADKIEDILVIGNVLPPKPVEPPRPRGRPRKQVFGSPPEDNDVG